MKPGRGQIKRNKDEGNKAIDVERLKNRFSVNRGIRKLVKITTRIIVNK